MDICHLYHGISSFTKSKEIIDSFEKSISVEIDDTKNIAKHDIYLIEIAKADKEISEKLKTIFKTRPFSLIYFLVPRDYNIMLIQLAFLLKSKAVITYTQDTQKVVSKMKNDFKTYEDEYLHNLLGKSLVNTEYFLLFKKSKLLYASKKLLEDFGLESLDEVENEISSKIDLEELLSHEVIIQTDITNKKESEKKYKARSVVINEKDEKLIYLTTTTKPKKVSSELNFIQNRLSFIELLKDKIIEKSISQKSFSIITIQIENIGKLSEELSEVELENLIKDFLLQVEILLGKNLILSQYDSDYYVSLFEDIPFEDLKSKAQTFHNKISAYLEKNKYIPIIGMYIYDIEDDELNDVLEILRHIHSKALTPEELKDRDIMYINDIKSIMSEQEAIMTLLDSSYTNSLEFKLLNIYNGLVINTASKIIKKKDGSIYVTFEQLQGIVMKQEEQTVMQCSNFIKDIKANVKFVSMDKKVAILEGFSFLNSNANARKHSRVTTSNKVLAGVGFSGRTLSGEISDISVNSIAVKTKFAKILKSIKNHDVVLSFILPSKRGEDYSLRLDAKIVFNQCTEEFCKIVCELYKDESSEAILMEYVYNRQKELIAELKKLIKITK